MGRRDDIDFEVSAYATSLRDVYMKLTLRNNSPNNYLISERVIFLDGFYSKHFKILGPTKIHCTFSSNNENPELIQLNSGNELTKTTYLSDNCIFNSAATGVYTIKFNTYFNLYDVNTQCTHGQHPTSEEFSWLIGSATFTIGDNSEDLALKSLDYGSGL